MHLKRSLGLAAALAMTLTLAACGSGTSSSSSAGAFDVLSRAFGFDGEPFFVLRAAMRRYERLL